MNLLLIDFFKRRWWVFALLMGLTGFTTAWGFPAVIAPVGLLALMFDAQRGYLRVIRSLPVSARAQSVAVWIIAVPLVPVLSFAVMACVDSTRDAYVSKAMLQLGPIWPRVLMSSWLGLGFAALMFMLGTALSTRPPESRFELFVTTLVGMMWGLAIPLSMMVLQFLPKTAAQLSTLHWIFIYLVPVLVVLSFLSAPAMTRRRMFGTVNVNQAKVGLGGEERASGGLSGLPLLVGRLLLISVGFYLLMILAQWLFIPLFKKIVMSGTAGVSLAETLKMTRHQSIAFAIILGAIGAERFNLRMLRQLPISTARLLGVLLLPAVIVSLLAAGGMTWIAGLGSQAASGVVNFAAQSVGIFGVAACTMAILLHMTSIGRYLTVFPLIMVLSVQLDEIVLKPGWMMTGGLLLSVVSLSWLYWGLSRSSKMYQPRSLIGPTWGQSFGGR